MKNMIPMAWSLPIAALVFQGLIAAPLATANANDVNVIQNCGCNATEPCSQCLAASCERGKPDCQVSRTTRVRRQRCPQCDCDSCILELKTVKVKKTCFKVEQKVVCIPGVRLPWQKCCPPGSSKSRTVTVLKKHKYECKKCSYQWSTPKMVYPGAQITKPAEQYSDSVASPVPAYTHPPQGLVFPGPAASPAPLPHEINTP